MVSVVVSRAAHDGRPPVIDVRLLGRFVVTGGGRSIRSWPRPSARRLCQLVLVSPGRRISRESACEALFPSLSPEAGARSLYKVQSMARQALKELRPEAAALLCADPSQLRADPAVALAVDLDAHEQALHTALRASPGQGREAALVGASGTPNGGQRTQRVITLGTEALELWKSQLPWCQLRCLALFPLASAYLDRGQTEKAVGAARQTLEPTLSQRPDELEATIQGACEAWDRGEPEKAGRLVGDAVTLARELRYA